MSTLRLDKQITPSTKLLYASMGVDPETKRKADIEAKKNEAIKQETLRKETEALKFAQQFPKPSNQVKNNKEESIATRRPGSRG